MDLGLNPLQMHGGKTETDNRLKRFLHQPLAPICFTEVVANLCLRVRALDPAVVATGPQQGTCGLGKQAPPTPGGVGVKRDRFHRILW